MNWFGGSFIPDVDAKLTLLTVSDAAGMTAIHISAYPINVTLHLAPAHLTQVRDKINEVLNDLASAPNPNAAASMEGAEIGANAAAPERIEADLARAEDDGMPAESEESYEASAALLGVRP